MRTKDEAKRRLVDASVRVAESLPLTKIKQMAVEAEEAAAALDKSASAGTSALTGREMPSPAELKTMKLANLRREFAERRRIVEDSLSVTEVAELLGKGRQYPHDRRKAGSLLGIKDNGQWFFPVWQFDPEGADGVVPGLQQVLKEMHGPIGDLGRVRWFITRKPLLEGRTPLAALAEGDTEDVIAEAESIGAS